MREGGSSLCLLVPWGPLSAWPSTERARPSVVDGEVVQPPDTEGSQGSFPSAPSLSRPLLGTCFVLGPAGKPCRNQTSDRPDSHDPGLQLNILAFDTVLGCAFHPRKGKITTTGVWLGMQTMFWMLCRSHQSLDVDLELNSAWSLLGDQRPLALCDAFILTFKVWKWRERAGDRVARPGSSPREQFLSTCLASRRDRLTATFSPVVSSGVCPSGSHFTPFVLSSVETIPPCSSLSPEVWLRSKLSGVPAFR